jgi:hypothetical protein
MFTVRHAWNKNNRHEKNIHYFNGWATNDAFKVGKKVIIPIHGSYDGAFYRDAKYSWAKWDLNYAAANTLADIDKVMNYFDGMEGYRSISSALNEAFTRSPHADTHSNIDSTYFKITVHKKGTIHLTFKNDDILRRFNVVACRGKGWLPQDYGTKPVKQLTAEETKVMEAFEGKASYQKNAGKPLFELKFNAAQIPYKAAA